ncbi:MAG: nucleotidyl transferase AbiEii/AbiGii toxin family protein, partial [Bacteroidota bacterium]
MSYLHTETVSTETFQIIKKISDNPDFKEFRLCGGTALALQIGHRISMDADFVSENRIDQNAVINSTGKLFTNITDVASGAHGVFLKIDSIKVDFLTWQIPFMRDAVELDGLSLTHIEEIIAMKFFAITQRGEKKDYMDI